MGSKVVQPTGDFHHQVVIPILRIPKQILNNATPFDSIDDMFNDDTDSRNQPILFFLLWRQFFSLRFLLRLKRRDPLRFIPLKSCVFVQGDVFGKCGMFFINDLFVMTFTLVGLAQVMDLSRSNSANHHIFDRMRFFFPL